MISMSRVICCFGRGCLVWLCILLATLLAFVLLHFVFQGQTGLLLQVSLDFLLLHSSPLWWKGHFFFFGVSSRMSCRSSCSTSASSALVIGTYTSITVILNGLPWKQAEIILSFLRLHPSTAFLTLFVDYEGYSISSKGFLPTVVDVMVIWIKLTHSYPF